MQHFMRAKIAKTNEYGEKLYAYWHNCNCNSRYTQEINAKNMHLEELIQFNKCTRKLYFRVNF